MYAVIKTGGKQYRVAVGDVVRVEKLAAEAGSSVNLDKVLMVADDAGVRVGVVDDDGQRLRCYAGVGCANLRGGAVRTADR